MLQKDCNTSILAYAPSSLKLHGYSIELLEGTAKHPNFGCFLYLPDNQRVKLWYYNNLYYLPVHTPTSTVTRAAKVQQRQPALKASVKQQMPPQTTPPPTLSVLWTALDVEASHNSWCHPGESKATEIVDQYPDLFPKDKAYLKAVQEHTGTCPVCYLMKGAHKYWKSKRQKEKEAARKSDKHSKKSDLARATGDDSAATAAVPSPAQLAEAGASLQSVRFAPDTKSISRLADDDFLQAFGAQKSRWLWGQVFNTDRTLHIDYAHAISLGYNKEGYYLVLVIDGVDFMWASPTRLKSNQEELRDDFICNSCITIGKIRMDLDSTMP
eukprot:3188412-Rhodomonas_salina.1